MLTQEEVVFKLRTLSRELCMKNDVEFQSHMKDGEFCDKFIHFTWGDNCKILTKIEMSKIKMLLENND